MKTPPLPPRTQILNTAVIASHMRYQVLLSVVPVEKSCIMHLSSAGALPSVYTHRYCKNIIMIINTTTDAASKIKQQAQERNAKRHRENLDTYTSKKYRTQPTHKIQQPPASPAGPPARCAGQTSTWSCSPACRPRRRDTRTIRGRRCRGIGRWVGRCPGRLRGCCRRLQDM